jgi:hypothetical protein
VLSSTLRKSGRGSAQAWEGLCVRASPYPWQWSDFQRNATFVIQNSCKIFMCQTTIIFISGGMHKPKLTISCIAISVQHFLPVRINTRNRERNRASISSNTLCAWILSWLQAKPTKPKQVTFHMHDTKSNSWGTRWTPPSMALHVKQSSSFSTKDLLRVTWMHWRSFSRSWETRLRLSRHGI